MPDIQITSFPGLSILLLLWVILYKFTHLLVMLLRRAPLIGWAIGPLGFSLMVVPEPSTLYIWLHVLCPALVSGLLLYVGLFTSLSPILLPQEPLVQIGVITGGVLITSTRDFVNALRDLRHPLWGEIRILRHIQLLRSSYAKIHFTPFGYSYLNDHFNATPKDLLQVLGSSS